MSQILDEMKRTRSKNISGGDDGKPELSMSELLASMVNQEFFFHHQPIIDLISGIQVGSEMLIRWVRKGEILAPMWFMPMIERHGLLTELDQYVIDRFIEIPWAETVKPDYKYRVFMNISAQSFIDPGFIIRITKATEDMRRNGIIPVMELTERTTCEIDFITKQMASLHDSGAEIALDDFGVGYSSLSRLIELPVDILKIDRGIIKLIGLSARAEAITHAVFRMSKELNIKVIAEGVETENQSNWLFEHGQCWAQGFYFARPTLAGFVTNADNHSDLDRVHG
jgi:sensor c-di-GMP phosphodiesterase-like protein